MTLSPPAKSQILDNEDSRGNREGCIHVAAIPLA